jgi:ribonucleoside-triphosphate reductase
MNHLNNEIYIHDLDSYATGSHNCLSIPFDKLLAEGFNTRQTDVRPAASINTAFQLIAVIFQLQSLQQFGGVSATHLDATFVPYVRK